MATTCPACGKPATGKFCANCGTALESPATCASCGNQLPAGARFCNMCGVPVAAAAGSAAPGASVAPDEKRGLPAYLPWVVAAVAVVGLAAALLIPRGDGEPSLAGTSPPLNSPPSGATPPDISSLTPREAADRLFNRVMMSVSAGDTTEARTFTPMAIAAYERAAPLDIDGRYHLATLHIVDSNFEAAGVEADSILAEVPTHLYGLFTAAQVAASRGDTNAALDLFRRFLDNYDDESATGRSEYLDHPAILPAMRQEAVAATEAASG